MKTGQDVTDAGLYASDCCGEEIFLEGGTTFPRCLKCMGLSKWEVVDVPLQKAA
jgi:hypothetical protein